MSGYATHLTSLLLPLQVYDLREGSFSGGEIAALGAAMDALAAVIDDHLAQALVPTATEEGLSRWESLVLYHPVGDFAMRRRALSALLGISWDGFTPAALAAAASGCGLRCTIEETGPCAPLVIRFPDIYGRPVSWARVQWILEELMPAHLELVYLFRWITWRETHEKALTFGQVSAISWYQWMTNDF